jgi:hypothetical protein
MANPRNLFDILPPELIFHILDFMCVNEYSGFPCTCRCAIEAVNANICANSHSLRLDDGPERSLSGKLLRELRKWDNEFVGFKDPCLGGFLGGDDADL